MIGVWLEDGRLDVRRDLPRPEVERGEAIVRVRSAGICGTDLELVRGYRSFGGIPGHEFVGVVDAGPPEWIGTRVVAEINVTCRSRGLDAASGPARERDDPQSACDTCSAGRPHHCERRQVVGISGRHGAFAEWVSVPVANLHAVPAAVPDEAAVFVEPLAAAFRVLEQIDPAASRCLVLGPGRLGQLVARVLALHVPQITVAGRSPAGLARARAVGLETRDLDSVGHAVYDVVVECTGSEAGFARSLEAVRPEGTVIVKSTYANELDVDISSVVVDEVKLVGSRCGPFPRALEALERGELPVLDLIDHRLALSDAVSAFERAGRPGVAKVLLSPWASG